MSPATSRRLPLAGGRPRICPDTGCEAPLELPYMCHSCGTLLRDLPGLTHFARLGVAPTLDVRPADLEERYLDLSRRLHPDRMVRKGPQTQARALALSAALNQAYNALRDERQRAEHLLAIHGGKTADQDRRTPPAFLVEQLELREQVEAARAAGDADRLHAFGARAREQRAAGLARVRALFADPTFPSPELLSAIREQLNVVAYWQSLASELDAARLS